MANPLLDVGDNAVEKVAKLLDTTEEEIDKSVKKLQEWMETQSHLPEIMEYKKLQNFVILNKGNLKKAKDKIGFYYTMRLKWGDIFENINPKLPYGRKLQDAYYFLPLPKLTENMCRVFIFKIRDRDLAAEVNHWDTLRYVINGQEVRLVDDVCYGDIFILDASDIPFRFFLTATPLWVYRTIKIYQSVFSMRLKAVYVISAPAAIKGILAVAKSLLTPKIFSRIHMCDSYDFLKATFDSRILPRDYGGNEKSLAEIQEMWQTKLKDYEEMFEKLDRVRVNQVLRPKRKQRGVARYFSFGGFGGGERLES